MSAALAVRDLVVARGRRPVLAGVDLEVEAGGAVALLGVNGGGKSTLLQAISGLLPIQAGTVEALGQHIVGWPPHRILEAGVVHVPGGRATFPDLTVAESLRLACWPFRRDRDRVEDGLHRVMERFPALARRSAQRAGTLSGGEQQVLALAKAIVHDPAVLLVDELTLGLAPAAVEQLVEVVAEIRERGPALVLVDQRLTLAARLTERAVFLERGRVRFSGPTADLADRDDLVRAVFLPDAER